MEAGGVRVDEDQRHRHEESRRRLGGAHLDCNGGQAGRDGGARRHGRADDDSRGHDAAGLGAMATEYREGGARPRGERHVGRGRPLGGDGERGDDSPFSVRVEDQGEAGHRGWVADVRSTHFRFGKKSSRGGRSSVGRGPGPLRDGGVHVEGAVDAHVVRAGDVTGLGRHKQ